MKRVLVTGMSGVGKSSVLDELRQRGYKTVDTDDDGLAEAAADGQTRWDEQRLQAVLSTEDADVLFVSGTADNMGRFRRQFDHVILLSAPAPVMVERLTTRTNNPYGQRPEQVVESLDYKETVEPLLRAIATMEIDTQPPLDQVVAAVLDHVGISSST
jgi:dephospho-CoA kinase